MFGLFKVNKIKILRKYLKDPKWLINKYLTILREEKELNHFETFECSSFFKGYDLAEHNRKVLSIRRKRYYRQLKFIKESIKNIDIQYYLKYIGKISDEELKVITRDDKIKRLCQK